MALEFIVKRVKALFLLLLGLFRRAVCCLKRRRRSSCDSVPLLTVGVVPNHYSSPSETENWDQWGDEKPVAVLSDKPPNLIQAKIEEYRQLVAKPLVPQEMLQRTDYFEDMAPKITRQKKIVVREKKAERANSDPSKFAVAVERVPTNELQVWEDNATTWEDETLQDFVDPTEAVREQRRREREKRLLEQHQRRIELNMRSQPLGEKISS